MPNRTRILALLLAVFMFFTSGCATAYTTASHDGTAVSQHHAGDSYQTVGHGEAVAWIAVGFLVAAVVFVDLILLPVTYEDPFPCCREVVTLCH
jgi:uncharacterized protein YceK